MITNLDNLENYEPSYCKEYITRELSEVYKKFKGKKPKNKSLIFQKIRDYVLDEFDIAKEHICMDKTKTFGELVTKILRHAIPGSSPHKRDLIKESEEFYDNFLPNN